MPAAAPLARRTRARPAGDVRTRILEATLELASRQGLHALTTVAIARAARIHQPNFYAYFKNVDDCLAAAADHAAGEFLRLDDEGFRPVADAVRAGRPHLELSERYHTELLLRLLANRRVTELFLRHRHDLSPFGKGMRRLEQQALARVRANLWELAAAAGADARHLDDIALLAEMHVSAFLTVSLALIEGRASDVRAAGVSLAHNADATVRATLRRVLGRDARR
jgi:AcrR family transcriptional regulator